MIAAPQHEIKTPDAVIADDVICQSFIQSSCTLAYACLLIRRGRFELAAHVLHSLEAKQASRFKDMVFYLQAQIGIETGEYQMVKKRLVPRAHQHPNDLVALSLLESCMYREFAAAEASSPRPPEPVAAPFGNAQAAAAAAMAADFAATQLPPGEPPSLAPARMAHPRPAAEPAVTSAPRTQSTPLVPARAPVPPSGLIEISHPAQPVAAHSAFAPIPAASAAAPAVSAPGPASAPARDGSRGHRAGASGDADLGLYQGIAGDPNSLALGLWGARVRPKSFCRAPELEPLMATLARELPASLQAACTALESGPIHKVCFSFNHLTASTFHAGSEGMALVTGPHNQSLLPIGRAYKTFNTPTGGGPASGTGAAQ